MEDLIIPRSKWSGTELSRKEDRGSTLTPNNHGEMCCIGHLLCVASPQFKAYVNRFNKMSHKLSMPIDAVNEDIEIPDWLYEIINDETEDGLNVRNENSPVAAELARINDLYHSEFALDDPTNRPQFVDYELKEATIAYVLEQYGYNVTFID